MIRLLLFISIISLFTSEKRGYSSIRDDSHDSLCHTYRQFMAQVNDVSGEAVDIKLLDIDVFILMDYGHCSKCVKDVLSYMTSASESGLKVAMIHHGSQEAYGSNRAARNKYRFEYGYLKEIYFSPVLLPVKSKVPVVAVLDPEIFVDYDNFTNEIDKLLQQVKKPSKNQ